MGLMDELDIWSVMSTARTIRRYREEPVEDAIVMRCLEAATWAPSGGNQQRWRFVILKSPELRKLLLAARAQGLGAAAVLWHRMVEDELRSHLGIPDDWKIGATVTAGWPAGHHGPLDRRPVDEVISVDEW